MKIYNSTAIATIRATRYGKAVKDDGEMPLKRSQPLEFIKTLRLDRKL